MFSVDSCVPGDIVTVSGIVKVNSIDIGFCMIALWFQLTVVYQETL